MDSIILNMKTGQEIPIPQEDERPSVYADRVGRWYAASMPDSHRKGLGQYLTPIEVAVFMARLCNPATGSSLRVLDPGAGAGVLSCALCEVLAERPVRPKEVHLIAYEMDAGLAAGHLTTCLSYAQEWLRVRGVTLTFTVSTDDFVMAHAESLEESFRLFSATGSGANAFDIVISNPPYFKVAKSDPRAQAALRVVHGQPNIYVFFMAVSASLLKPGGQLVFITPRSYAAGPYFRLFRRRFFEVVQPEAIHLFGSRRDAFSRDDVLQENVILLARRVENRCPSSVRPLVKISFSAGIRDLPAAVRRTVPLPEVLDTGSKDWVLRIPVVDEDDTVLRIVNSWPGSLRAYGFEISTGPVVPFRATSFIADTGSVPRTHAPLLWMQNVTAMHVKWPVEARGKAQYIKIDAASMVLLVPDKNYVLLRRFSAKEQARRLTAAPFLAGKTGSPLIGLENHLNYIHRPGGSLTPEIAYGLAVLFNSALLDAFFRVHNGNTQVSATEIRAMPLPPLGSIAELGRRAMAACFSNENIDFLVEQTLNIGIRRTIVDGAAHG